MNFCSSSHPHSRSLEMSADQMEFSCEFDQSGPSKCVSAGVRRAELMPTYMTCHHSWLWGVRSNRLGIRSIRRGLRSNRWHIRSIRRGLRSHRNRIPRTRCFCGKFWVAGRSHSGGSCWLQVSWFVSVCDHFCTRTHRMVFRRVYVDLEWR